MRFLEQMRDVLIVSMIASFIWFAVYVVFSMLRSGRRNTRITVQPFKLYP